MIAYVVVTDERLDVVVKEVNQLLTENWQPLGGVRWRPVASEKLETNGRYQEHSGVWFQAMVGR